MRYIIKNDIMAVEVDSFGAELKSVIKDTTEFMWNGDAKYWGRTSPVLFPFVGGLKDGKYTLDNKEYPMGQHGFARDMEFSLTEQAEDRLVFTLLSNEETLKKYPFSFELEITYTIKGNTVTVAWKVKNTNDKKMSFSIGAHPAFMCPIKDGSQTDYKLKFDTEKDIEYYLLDGGLLDKTREYKLLLKDGYADITADMFDKDALIIEDKQARKISLCYPDGKEYVTVTTDAPLFGVWSPTKKNAPFICIEPWYGRCDAVDFDGDLFQREYANGLEAGEEFDAEYNIEFN